MNRRSSFVLCMALLLCPSIRLFAATNPDWTAAQKPFHIVGNLFYVGSRDLAAYLIVTPAGNILINANLKSSPPQIRSSVEQLGFRWRDTRILLISHAHFDHAAGSAEILHETGATMMVMDGDARTIEEGDPHDFAGSDVFPFPPAHVSRVLQDGETVALGGTILTAHKTAGHTPGCTTWTMQVRDHGRIENVAIVGGLYALSSYRLVDIPAKSASYPGIADDFERGFTVLRSLPVDIFLGAHGIYFNMQQKMSRMPAEGSSVWIDPDGYRRTIADAQATLEHNLETQRALAAKATRQKERVGYSFADSSVRVPSAR
jgi:metallo-beta-lactamase class B